MPTSQSPQALAITGATIIDATGNAPVKDGVIIAEKGRISAIGGRDTPIPAGARRLDAKGKYIIPGLMDANVHLLGDIRLEQLARYWGRYEDLIAEAAQVALKGGLTTVFDTWGPRRALMNVRDRINAGEVPGSRFFCAGNIIGFDGPFSPDFIAKAAEVASAAFVKRIEAMWVENSGRHLMWLTPEGVAKEVRAYIAKGIDFIKYGSNEHFEASAGAMLAFSPRQQAAIVEEAHRAGITAQAHSMSVEGLHLAVEAGCDLITHCNITGPVPIPEATLELMAKRKTGAVLFPFTQRRLEWLMEKAKVPEKDRCLFLVANTNARNLIRSGAPLLLAFDAHIPAPEMANDPVRWSYVASGDDNPHILGTGHFAVFKAMEEMGCPPITLLQAATKNMAVAYGKDKDLGTLEAGKIADMLILDKDPLQSAENYRSIHMILKDGAVVDRDALPLEPILTKPMDPPLEEEASYIPALASGARLPMCPTCWLHG